MLTSILVLLITIYLLIGISLAIKWSTTDKIRYNLREYLSLIIAWPYYGITEGFK